MRKVSPIAATIISTKMDTVIDANRLALLPKVIDTRVYLVHYGFFINAITAKFPKSPNSTTANLIGEHYAY